MDNSVDVEENSGVITTNYEEAPTYSVSAATHIDVGSTSDSLGVRVEPAILHTAAAVTYIKVYQGMRGLSGKSAPTDSIGTDQLVDGSITIEKIDPELYANIRSVNENMFDNSNGVIHQRGIGPFIGPFDEEIKIDRWNSTLGEGSTISFASNSTYGDVFDVNRLDGNEFIHGQRFPIGSWQSRDDWSGKTFTMSYKTAGLIKGQLVPYIVKVFTPTNGNSILVYGDITIDSASAIDANYGKGEVTFSIPDLSTMTIEDGDTESYIEVCPLNIQSGANVPISFLITNFKLEPGSSSTLNKPVKKSVDLLACNKWLRPIRFSTASTEFKEYSYLKQTIGDWHDMEFLPSFSGTLLDDAAIQHPSSWVVFSNSGEVLITQQDTPFSNSISCQDGFLSCEL